MEPGLKNSVENEGGLAHQMFIVQLSIPTINFSVILKEIERTTLICDYFLLYTDFNPQTTKLFTVRGVMWTPPIDFPNGCT